MNNQPRLIDADKLLEWLEKSEEADKFWTTTVPPIEKYDLIEDAINEGKFDPDPIPLPTIKYQVVLYNLKNGLEKLEGVITDQRPTNETAELGRMLYGAERYEIVEVSHE